MGKVTYAPGIQYVKGSLAKPKKVDGHNHGDYLIGTHREAPSSSTQCTNLYIRKADTYVRSTKPTANEIEKRTMFATAAAATRARMQNVSTIAADKAAFKAQSQYKTLYQYIFNDEYDKLRG